MPATGKPTITRHEAELALTRLHYLKAGDGPPMVMVPATISEIDSWLDLVAFVAQRFTVYFFELPGHGRSTAFDGRFDSALVAETVGHLLDHEGHERASLMGFSFGGILALQSLERLEERVDKVALLSPCVTHAALLHHPAKKATIAWLSQALRREAPQRALLKMMHAPATARALSGLVGVVGDVEHTGQLTRRLLDLPASTLDALVFQIAEIVTCEFRTGRPKYRQPLFFGMSVRDPLLDFDLTLSALKDLFETVAVERFDFPYHQPPKPFQFDELNRDFGRLLELMAG